MPFRNRPPLSTTRADENRRLRDWAEPARFRAAAPETKADVMLSAGENGGTLRTVGGYGHYVERRCCPHACRLQFLTPVQLIYCVS